MIRTRTAGILTALMALAAAAPTALAQEALRLPRIDESPTAPRLWMYALFLLLLAVIVFASSLRSKRTHQD